jgi:hypothetical protein
MPGTVERPAADPGPAYTTEGSMTQLPLLTRAGKPARKRTPREEQAHQIGRVRERIADVVLAFLRERVGQQFYVSELTAYVTERRGGAPGSPDRILRLLRQGGECRYAVVDRGASLYRVEWVR